jgi:hypothetical protein
MKQYSILVFLAFAIVACAHGKTENFPEAPQTEDAARVTIIRNNNLLGMGISIKVYFNEKVIARLRAGEYTSFLIEPGLHSVGTSNTKLTVPCSAGQKYYFLLSAQYSQFGFEIERIGNAKGEEWIAKTELIK